MHLHIDEDFSIVVNNDSNFDSKIEGRVLGKAFAVGAPPPLYPRSSFPVFENKDVTLLEKK